MARRCHVSYRKQDDPGRDLAEEVGDADIILVVVTDDLSSKVIERLPATVRAIATYSVGYDHIDLAAAAARGIAVLHTPGVLSVSVAENALFLMLGVARRATESINLLRQRRWSGWTPTQLIGFELGGKALGILGFGRIGREVARRAQALGMTIAYHDLQASTDSGDAAYRFEPDLGTFLGSVDILLLAAPSTPKTRGILNATTIGQLRRGACIVNIARGDLVDDDALIDALSSGQLWGAGLDVFNNEPNLDPRYLAMPNVFLLPHVGSSTAEARARMAEILLDGLEAIDRGERPWNQIA
ncbi:MAG: D-glycerate dehydrogenase [Caulobacteraceae bacterium]|nr:D-glycerate dehydrogenase [Caulobacteraceae bacterium]